MSVGGSSVDMLVAQLLFRSKSSSYLARSENEKRFYDFLGSFRAKVLCMSYATPKIFSGQRLLAGLNLTAGLNKISDYNAKAINIIWKL